MKKIIYLALGDGFNAHFHLKTSYYDFIKYHYKNNKELYKMLFTIEKKCNQDAVLRYIDRNNIEYNIWDCFFCYGLEGINVSKCKKVNFEKLQCESFDSGFWFDVLQKIYPLFGISDNEKAFVDMYPYLKTIDDSTSVDSDGEELLRLLRKTKFFVILIKARYKKQLNDALEMSAEKCISTFYEILYQELLNFENDFGLFVERQSHNCKKSLNQVDFIDKMKNIIDPNNEYELQILNFNFNTIGNDVSSKYRVEYVHGDFEHPIFGFALQHAEYERHNDNSYINWAKIMQNKYACLFSPLYRRFATGQNKYSDIIDKSNENIIAFYGLSFSKYDCEEFYLLHRYQSKNHPIYHFYSNYEKNNPNRLGDYLYNLYSNFYVDYYEYVVMDQFYWLIENGTIEFIEI